jgi:16S rRNA (cytosine1402-N4)-methyltransferase
MSDPIHSKQPVHRPVMLREVLKAIDPQPGQTIVDGTLGAAGHATKIAEAIGPNGLLIGMDRDPMMLDFAAEKLTDHNCHLANASYAQLPEILASLGRTSVDGIVVDLGLSSDQLADTERGFGFESDGPLDLRFDTSAGRPAWKFLAECSQQELATALVEYGEERFSDAIAQHIVSHRKQQPIRTGAELSRAVASAIPHSARRQAKKNPATRVFQALRIIVNEELEQLRIALETAFPNSLVAGGRLVVLTFHSLEDRLVKEAFRRQEQWQIQNPKPIRATPAEVRANPRSRSAKLRAAIRK